MPTNPGSPPICTSCFSVDPSLHDAGSIGPGNCPGSTVRECGDPCYWTVYHDPDATGLPRSGPPRMSYCRRPKSRYKMLPLESPDRIRVAFDDHRLVANAGLLLPASLALRLGLNELADSHVDLGDAPGRANTGDKLMTLVASALAGGDCIGDTDALRAGGTARLIGSVVKAPSTLGTFLRSFPLGACEAVGPGQPGVAGPGLGRWGRARRKSADHRPGIHHLRDLRPGRRVQRPHQHGPPERPTPRCSAGDAGSTETRWYATPGASRPGRPSNGRTEALSPRSQP